MRMTLLMLPALPAGDITCLSTCHLLLHAASCQNTRPCKTLVLSKQRHLPTQSLCCHTHATRLQSHATAVVPTEPSAAASLRPHHSEGCPASLTAPPQLLWMWLPLTQPAGSNCSLSWTPAESHTHTHEQPALDGSQLQPTQPALSAWHLLSTQQASETNTTAPPIFGLVPPTHLLQVVLQASSHDHQLQRVLLPCCSCCIYCWQPHAQGRHQLTLLLLLLSLLQVCLHVLPCMRMPPQAGPPCRTGQAVGPKLMRPDGAICWLGLP